MQVYFLESLSLAYNEVHMYIDFVSWYKYHFFKPIEQVFESDSDGDEKLTKDEVLKKYDLFVGSKATDFGEALNRHDEFWDLTGET